MIKQDPIKAMREEERREKLIPKNLAPDGPTVSLKVKLDKISAKQIENRIG